MQANNTSVERKLADSFMNGVLHYQQIIGDYRHIVREDLQAIIEFEQYTPEQYQQLRAPIASPFTAALFRTYPPQHPIWDTYESVLKNIM